MNKKLVCGVGVNDADYVVTVHEKIMVAGKRKKKQVWVCPLYRLWKGMLQRGYSAQYKEKHPAYKDVTVCKEWWLFSNFKKWMEEQPFEGMQLDKDILVKGNKEYNPNTCAFVPQRINALLTDCGSARGLYPIGVCYIQKPKDMINEYKKPYKVRVSIGCRKGVKCLGMFSTPIEAHKSWQLAKADVIEDAIDWWKNDNSVSHTYRQDVAESLLERINQLRYDAEHNIETLSL